MEPAVLLFWWEACRARLRAYADPATGLEHWAAAAADYSVNASKRAAYDSQANSSDTCCKMATP